MHLSAHAQTTAGRPRALYSARRVTLTRPGQGKVSQCLPRLLLLPLLPHHHAAGQDLPA
ncbi:hypothetical protein [Streptomyces altiplanensis]